MLDGTWSSTSCKEIQVTVFPTRHALSLVAETTALPGHPLLPHADDGRPGFTRRFQSPLSHRRCAHQAGDCRRRRGPLRNAALEAGRDRFHVTHPSSARVRSALARPLELSHRQHALRRALRSGASTDHAGAAGLQRGTHLLCRMAKASPPRRLGFLARRAHLPRSRLLAEAPAWTTPIKVSMQAGARCMTSAISNCPDNILRRDRVFGDSDRGLNAAAHPSGHELLRTAASDSSRSRLNRPIHQTWKVSGYPEKRSGEDIPLRFGVFVRCADVLDALTTRSVA